MTIRFYTDSGKKHPGEFAKDLKREEDFHRENPDYQPRLKEWFCDGE